MNEAQYQAKLIKKLRHILPGCHIELSDASRTQGIPDILILWRNQWAMLEVKLSEDSPYQPNQEHYIKQFGEMSFCKAIYPENEEAVLDELQRAFGFTRKARAS